jgi:hypothetical protein
VDGHCSSVEKRLIHFRCNSSQWRTDLLVVIRQFTPTKTLVSLQTSSFFCIVPNEGLISLSATNIRNQLCMQLVFSFEDPRVCAGSSEVLRTPSVARARQKPPFLLSSGPFSLPILSLIPAEVRKGH